MKKICLTAAALLVIIASLAFAPAAYAHPLGNFTINQYAGLTIRKDSIRVEYIVDMAEIPAFQEIAEFDSNGNGTADSSEASAYHADKCASLLPDLKLILNGQPLTLAPTSSSVEFPAGVGGLPTLRLTCEFNASFVPSSSALGLSFVNSAYSDRIGWKEVVVIADGVTLKGDFSSTSLSARLTNYPQDLLTSPLNQRQVEVEITSITSSTQNTSSAPATGIAPSLTDRNDQFTRLILLEDFTLPTLLLALAISFIWGAAHAMTPGHGKTIVGAYLVGSRGTIRHAVYLGLTTTITHTLGVFALGLITLFAAQYILPEKLFPWLSLLSGLFVVGIGINLFAERFKSSGLRNWIASLKPKPVKSPQFVFSSLNNMTSASQPHRYVLHASHDHPHPHDHGHSHDGSHSHSHDGDHDHYHDHSHDHHDHHPGHSYDHHHDHSHDHHHHGDGGHSHMPPEQITWRNLLALGVSGGLIPCPSALVVLLGAIALNKIGLGLILVLAFSLGLAGALTAIGVAFIYAGKLFERFPTSGKVVRTLPVFSALFISLIGLGIVIKAAMEIGVF